MVESFGGSLNLIIWLLATAGAGYYAYRCFFGKAGMIEQYGFGDQSAFVKTLSVPLWALDLLWALFYLLPVRKVHGHL